MKREELIAMGISEENVEKIIADYGSAVQREQAKAAELCLLTTLNICLRHSQKHQM